MTVFKSEEPLNWGNLDLPLFGIGNDWSGKTMANPVGFSLAMDSDRFWFVATRRSSVRILPGANAGEFTPELWKSDVSELFLANPKNGRYLEFNIAANGAWWASAFESPRTPAGVQPDFRPHVSSFADLEDSSWVSALSISLEFLGSELGFGDETTANVTAIQDSPDQIFLSAVNLPGEQPDFHQPSDFPQISRAAIPRN